MPTEQSLSKTEADLVSTVDGWERVGRPRAGATAVEVCEGLSLQSHGTSRVYPVPWFFVAAESMPGREALDVVRELGSLADEGILRQDICYPHGCGGDYTLPDGRLLRVEALAGVGDVEMSDQGRMVLVSIPANPHAGVDGYRVTRQGQRLLEAWRCPVVGHEGRDKRTPQDLVTAAVAVMEFRVSRSTLRRAVKEGRLAAYRANAAASNSAQQFSRSDLARLWPKAPA